MAKNENTTKKRPSKLTYIIATIVAIIFMIWLINANNKQDSINEIERIIWGDTTQKNPLKYKDVLTEINKAKTEKEKEALKAKYDYENVKNRYCKLVSKVGADYLKENHNDLAGWFKCD